MPKAKSNSAARAATIRLVEPMYAQLVQQLPDSEQWLYEVKFDGYRCLTGRDSTGVTLWSRRGNDLTAQFPNIAKGCEQLRRAHSSTAKSLSLTRTDASRSTCCNIIGRRHKPCCFMRAPCRFFRNASVIVFFDRCAFAHSVESQERHKTR